MSVYLQKKFFRALNEEWYEPEVVIPTAKKNGFFDQALKELQSNLEYDEKSKTWVYLRGHYSGRDFYDPVPIWHITDDEKFNLAEELIEYNWIEDYDWGDMDIDDVKESLYSDDVLIDSLFDALDSGITEGLKEHLISERDWDEITDDIMDDYWDGNISAQEKEKRLNHASKMLDEDKTSDSDLYKKILKYVKDYSKNKCTEEETVKKILAAWNTTQGTKPDSAPSKEA